MLDLRTELERLEPSIEASPWAGHEHVRGYGVFGLPFDSGHILALRVFPTNDFAPYMTVWHRNPEGEWSIYYDAPRADVACPRYYGCATRLIRAAKIDVEWLGPSKLNVRMGWPELDWTVWMREPAVLRPLNAIGKRMPLWSWKYAPLLKAREMMARSMGVGKIKLAGEMPSGHFGILMPQRMYLIDRTSAQLSGEDLGKAAQVRPNPTIGGVPLPARGIFAIGQAHWEILDPAEYHQTRAAAGMTGEPPSAIQTGSLRSVPT